MNLGQIQRRPIQSDQLGLSIADIGTELKKPIVEGSRKVFNLGMQALILVGGVFLVVKMGPSLISFGKGIGKKGTSAAKTGYRDGLRD